MKDIIEKLGITPGPWNIGTAGIEENARLCIGVPYNQIAIFDCWLNKYEGKTDKSNATLCAAAPEMLKALIDISMAIFPFDTPRKTGSQARAIKIIEKACYPKQWPEIKGSL